MAYTPRAWKDLPDKTTPLNAGGLNHLETQYGEAVAYTDAKVAAIPAAPVQSVNGKTGTVALTFSDVGAQPEGNYATTAQLVDSLALKAPLVHTHVIGQVDGLTDALAGKQTSGDYATNAALTSGLAGKAPTVHTHTADQVSDTATKVLMTPAERTKLAGIATGATANSTDAQLRDRSTQTGVQAISTVTGLQAALDAKADLTSLRIPIPLTQTAYNALTPPVPGQIYVITGP